MTRQPGTTPTASGPQPDAPSDTAALLRRFGLLLAGVLVLVAIGVLWIVGQPMQNCRVAMAAGDLGQYWPGPGTAPPCVESSATTPAVVTAVILIALFAVLLVVHVVPLSRVHTLTLIVGGLMLATFVIGLAVTIEVATAEPPVIYYEQEY